MVCVYVYIFKNIAVSSKASRHHNNESCRCSISITMMLKGKSEFISDDQSFYGIRNEWWILSIGKAKNPSPCRTVSSFDSRKTSFKDNKQLGILMNICGKHQKLKRQTNAVFLSEIGKEGVHLEGSSHRGNG